MIAHAHVKRVVEVGPVSSLDQPCRPKLDTWDQLLGRYPQGSRTRIAPYLTLKEVPSTSLHVCMPGVRHQKVVCHVRVFAHSSFITHSCHYCTRRTRTALSLIWHLLVLR